MGRLFTVTEEGLRFPNISRTMPHTPSISTIPGPGKPRRSTSLRGEGSGRPPVGASHTGIVRPGPSRIARRQYRDSNSSSLTSGRQDPRRAAGHFSQTVHAVALQVHRSLLAVLSCSSLEAGFEDRDKDLAEPQAISTRGRGLNARPHLPWHEAQALYPRPCSPKRTSPASSLRRIRRRAARACR